MLAWEEGTQPSQQPSIFFATKNSQDEMKLSHEIANQTIKKPTPKLTLEIQQRMVSGFRHCMIVERRMSSVKTTNQNISMSLPDDSGHHVTTFYSTFYSLHSLNSLTLSTLHNFLHTSLPTSPTLHSLGFTS
jgi:hypothetical protein